MSLLWWGAGNQSTYIFGVVSETSAVGRVKLEVEGQEFSHVHHCISYLVQPQVELLFEEG